MRIYTILVYAFLYLPIALIVFLSFNSGNQAMVWKGFSVQWYGKAFSNPLIVEALVRSLHIAAITAGLSAIIGTLTAIGLERTRGWVHTVFESLIYIAILVPGIVIGISSLITLVTIFDIVNPVLEALFNARVRMG
jgi:spermidine/putrescine transport system permease protein